MMNVHRRAKPPGPSTPYARAVSFVGSLKIGYRTPSESANARLVSGVSTLAAKYWTSNSRSCASLAPSDRHSIVQPPVNAFGNHASTTAEWSR
jgi:hypothetical protein